MRRARRSREDPLRVQGGDQIARMTLELAVGTDPIAGRIVGDDGASRRFTGWLGLVRALEEATARGGDMAQGGDRIPSRGGATGA